ncbi:MAG: GAF domain-containing protein, partial [Chloroflexaceae bacterium]|nr:GAF domain-containing protein [Chloroflexaceae bacterium]
RQLMNVENIRSMLMVPLVAHDQMLGVLAVATTAMPRRFTPYEISLARLLAGQLAAAIISFRLTEAAQRRNAELETLNDIASVVASSLDPREVYHLVVQKLNAYFRVDAGSLLMRDEVTGDLEFVMTLEAGEEKLLGVRIPKGQGVAGDVAETQLAAVVPDARNDPRFYSKVSDDLGYETRSILCVPMVVKGRTIGVIELLNKREGTFTDDDAKRLSRMAATIGVAIENARLFQQAATLRDRFEAIVYSTTDGILMANTSGVIVTANPMAAMLLQVEPQALVGRLLGDVLAELQARTTVEQTPPWWNEDTAPLIVRDLEIAGVSQRHFLRHFALPVRDTSGQEIGQLALFQDISKERELIQIRDDYTGMLVHDLRAPLTAIMNGIMMVKRGLGGPVTAQQSELLSIAHQSSQTMLEMINTLLDIARLELGRMPLNPEPLSPYALADEACDRLRGSAQNQQVRLEQSLPVGLPLIEADHDKIVRVLQNLLDNAIKFSPTGAEVLLGAAALEVLPTGEQHVLVAPTVPLQPPQLATDTWLVFWVRDHGPGIPPQYHERVFEKFGQVQGRKVRGSGLGLTFCKLAVEAHHGVIWLESSARGGSSFAFALPLTHDVAVGVGA